MDNPYGERERLLHEIAKRKEAEKQLRRLENELGELKQTEHQLHQLAYYDDLTSLPNRVYFNEQLHRVLMRENAQISVMFIDIDRFKQLNDSIGHENGNAVLHIVGKRFSKSLPDKAFLARYGGDEFSILFEAEDEDIYLNIARKVLASLTEPISIVGNKLTVTASLGLSSYPTRSKNISELLRHADSAMYRAKKQGGNRVCIYRSMNTCPNSYSTALNTEPVTLRTRI